MAGLATDGKSRLWEELDSVKAGMLGVTGSSQHMQPMTHMADRDAAVLWFISARHTDLVRAVGIGAEAKFTITSEAQDFWASVEGPLEQSEDAAKLDQLWSPIAAAWFDEGRADSDVALLQLIVREAALWTSTGNPLTFGLEIARANVAEERKPDLGEHVVVSFR